MATIRRRIKNGSLPNAAQGARGAWTIPVTDLIAAGLNPGQPSPPDHSQRVVTDLTHNNFDHSHDHGQNPSPQVKTLHDLEQKLLTEQREVEHLRTQVSTLQNNLDDLRTAMRMFEAGSRDQDDHDGMTVTGPDRTDSTAVESVRSEPTAGGSFLRRLFRRSK
ncbi:hypothetical protein AAFP32_12690 [Brevibacterium sp. CBA3109]|uniref:Uncharacterized protein n=1 Tax=Brevibacterium koreense TaxID=3140787 RepID=A0AAU7UJ21_9MICO